MASGTISGSTANQYITARIVWSSSANTENNQSTVTATLSYRKSSSSTSKTYGKFTGKLTVNGVSVSFSKYITLNANNSWVTIGSNSVTVNHNADGSKSIAISATGSIANTSFSSTSCSATVALDSIPRATTPTTSGTWNVGNTVTINTPRASSAFTHTVQYSLNNSSWTNIKTGVTTSTTWTLPAALATAKPNAASGTVYIRCITYNGSTNIGNKTITRTYNITSSYAAPSVAIAASQTNDASIAQYIRGRSKVTLKATATLKHSATAKTYVFNYGGTTKTVTTTASTASVTFSLPSNAAASYAYSVKLTDSRGYTASASGTVTTISYAAPSLSSVTAIRGDYDGTTFKENSKGNSLQIVAAGTITSLSNANAKNYKVEYRLSNSTAYTTLINTKAASAYAVSVTEYTDAIFSENASYVLRFSLSDSFESISQIVDVPSQKVLMNFSANGKAMAIGGIASVDDALEIMTDLYATGGIKPMQLANGTNFDEIIKSGVYIGNASSGDYTNPPITTGTFILDVSSAGSAGQVMQRYSYVHKNQYKAYVRFLYESTWGTWQPTEGFTSFSIGAHSGRVRFANGFVIQWGRVSITPTAANTITEKVIKFPIAHASSPICHVSANSAAPNILTCSYTADADELTLCMTRTNTTATWISWTSFGISA